MYLWDLEGEESVDLRQDRKLIGQSGMWLGARMVQRKFFLALLLASLAWETGFHSANLKAKSLSPRPCEVFRRINSAEFC